MTSLLYIAILTVVFCFKNIPYSYGQSNQNIIRKQIEIKIIKTITFDTSKTAIILFDPKSSYPFDTSNKPSLLTQKDIYDVDSLLVVCVTEYNNSLDKEHKERGIDLKKYNYKKQLIVVRNKKGEKEVWVNCFCKTEEYPNWKKNILLMLDGGNCYFNFKLNLTTKHFYKLLVNGEA